MTTPPDDKTPLEDDFDRELAKLEAVAAAARERAGMGEIPSARPLAEDLHITLPPPEAQHAAEEYWQERRNVALRREREAEFKRRETRERTIAGKLPPNFSWAAFEAPTLQRRVRNPRAIELATTSIDEARVVLTGAAGSGKTSLAAAMLRAHYVLRGGTIAFEPAWELATARSRHPLGQGEPDVVRHALDAEVLVLDDLGNEKPNPTSAVDDIIFGRHWGARTTWITTSKRPEEIAERYGDGIARRIFEHAVLIDCEGKRESP
jgi:DNA replication protein DnaC